MDLFSCSPRVIDDTKCGFSSYQQTPKERWVYSCLNERIRKITLTAEGKRIYTALSRTLNDLNQRDFRCKNEEIWCTLSVRPTFFSCRTSDSVLYTAFTHQSIETLLTGNENISFQGHGIDIAIYFDDQFPDKLYEAFMHEHDSGLYSSLLQSAAF